MVLAPGRFSTTTDCLSSVDRCVARVRASTSTEPPGAYGAMSLMGLLG